MVSTFRSPHIRGRGSRLNADKHLIRLRRADQFNGLRGFLAQLLPEMSANNTARESLAGSDAQLLLQSGDVPRGLHVIQGVLENTRFVDNERRANYPINSFPIH